MPQCQMAPRSQWLKSATKSTPHSRYRSSMGWLRVLLLHCRPRLLKQPPDGMWPNAVAKEGSECQGSRSLCSAQQWSVSLLLHSKSQSKLGHLTSEWWRSAVTLCPEDSRHLVKSPTASLPHGPSNLNKIPFLQWLVYILMHILRNHILPKLRYLCMITPCIIILYLWAGS